MKSDNKFHQREALIDTEPHQQIDEEALANTQCPMDIELRWQTEVSSSIYSTPLIADIDSDGKPEIVVPSFVHYLEVLEGVDGQHLPGWPVFHKSSSHTSPLLCDMNGDGVREIALADYNGEILFFSPDGHLLEEKLIVPRLRVKRNWFEGLDPDHVDHAHPDIHAELLANMSERAAAGYRDGHDRMLDVPYFEHNLTEQDLKRRQGQNQWYKQLEVDYANHVKRRNVTLTEEQQVLWEQFLESKKHLFPPLGAKNGSGGSNATSSAHDCEDGVPCAADGPHTPLNKSEGTPSVGGTDAENGKVAQGNRTDRAYLEGQWQAWHDSIIQKNGKLTAEEQEKWDNFVKFRDAQHKLAADTQQVEQHGAPPGAGPLTPQHDVANDTHPAQRRRILQDTAEAEGENELDEDAIDSFDVFRGEDDNDDPGLADEYHYDYDEVVDDDAWQDEDWSELEHETSADFVGIDAHILCTPVVADIDKDGKQEMVVAASYFFDREYYDDPKHAQELEEGLDQGKYIAGGIVVFDVESRSVKWSVHLDLTTDSTQYRAYIYSAPTVIDLDGDGELEVVVGTSEGFIYILHSDGQTMDHWPVQMGEVQGQVAVADINDDGVLEVVGVDTRGNVAAFDLQGKELWERHTASLIAQGATIGDVDGDGHTDVVVGTTSGHIWVFRGDTGEDVGSFPFRTHGRTMAPVLLVNLHKERKNGLHLVIASFDGYLYVIDGQTSCANAIDIGETSYSMVLADNVDGGDDLDLLVSTMNGNVFCFQTQASFHPLKAWRSQTQGRNLFSPRYNQEGIYLLPSSRQFRDISSDSFTVQFEIVDKRPAVTKPTLGAYNTSVWLMLDGQQQLLDQKVYEQAGVHSLRIKCPAQRAHGWLLLEMVDQHQRYFEDQVALSFHMHFYRLLKWLLALPLLGMLAVLVLRQHDGLEDQLPSFSADKHRP